MNLATTLAREQSAFLGRNRRDWNGHLESIRTFLGEGLRAGHGPALILGAGSGLEVPWALAPAGSTGWDADPWSRVRTCLRHRRWPAWVFQDLTGGMAQLAATAYRATKQPWSGRTIHPERAARRCAGLLDSLNPEPAALRAWIRQQRPGLILAANVMGQFGVLAQRIVEDAFAPASAWVADPELPDPLETALAAWTQRAVRAFLAALADSGAELWLVHDRGVVFGQEPVALGPVTDSWLRQLQAPGPLEITDPLCGVDVLAAFPGRELDRLQRWLWPVAPGQLHVMEALRVAGCNRE
jgi:hypothetical protein